MNALKSGRFVALVCVAMACGTALYIHQDSKPQTIIQKPVSANVTTPSQVQPISKAEAFLDSTSDVEHVFDDLIPAKNANGLPAGAWASTLIPVTTEPNLFRDPATGKLYRNQNGKIVQEIDPFADIPAAQPNTAAVREFSDAEVGLTPSLPTRRVFSYSVPRVSAPQIYVPPPIVSPIVTSYDPNSLANPYGAGSPYKADGLMNPYSQYGSPYSSKSWRNPYATDTPKLYDSQGNYHGKLSSNPYDADSTANPYGRYGSKYSADSINNPYGLGSPYNPNPIYVVPSP
jgi:hypothetical protein